MKRNKTNSIRSFGILRKAVYETGWTENSICFKRKRLEITPRKWHNFDLYSKDVRMNENKDFRSKLMNKHLKHEMKAEISDFIIFYNSWLRANYYINKTENRERTEVPVRVKWNWISTRYAWKKEQVVYASTKRLAQVWKQTGAHKNLGYKEKGSELLWNHNSLCRKKTSKQTDEYFSMIHWKR